MLRQLLTRTGGLALVVLVLGLLGLTTSCGGGDGYAAKDMVLVEFLFVDRALVPTAPTGTENLPRNAQLLMVFSEQVSPDTVTDVSIQIRYGPAGQSVPKGSFSVDGNTVRYDPTVTAQGQPNPFGFDPVTQYVVDIPNYEEQDGVVRNLDADPNLVTFFTQFVTSDGFIRELEPPLVESVVSIPDRFVVNPLTGDWPGNSIMEITFSEPMDPASFIPGGGTPTPNTTIDIRYVTYEPINQGNPPDDPGVAGKPIPGTFTADASATKYYFQPSFSFGDAKYVFSVELFQGLRDLSGNLLVNPRTFGPFTCDGQGTSTGVFLTEGFDEIADWDTINSNNPVWGTEEESTLLGQEITTDTMYVFGHEFQGDLDGQMTGDRGQYTAIISPMIGKDLNNYVSGVSPSTSVGRRVMWAFSDEELTKEGSITGAGWGPDSNATFASTYTSLFLRCGFQKNASMQLSPSFSGNYDGRPVVVYSGQYQVAQSANVGNTPGYPDADHQWPAGGTQSGCPSVQNPDNNWNQPLFLSTGFQAWPEFTTFFEWDRGDAGIPGDSVFLFDASANEGTTWQQLRGWFGATYPCSGFLIPGFPYRRMYSTYEEDTPNPPTGGAVVNPEPSITDSSFTVTARVSLAQVLYYTADPLISAQTTFGMDSDYLPTLLDPPVQSGGAEVRVEFQAAQVVDDNRRTVNPIGGPPTEWSEDINTCDGYACIRWRIWLISNLISNERARIGTISIPVQDMNPPAP